MKSSLGEMVVMYIVIVSTIRRMQLCCIDVFYLVFCCSAPSAVWYFFVVDGFKFQCADVSHRLFVIPHYLCTQTVSF
jgi:hypothetical protein